MEYPSRGDGESYSGGQHVKNLATEAGAKVTLWAQWEHDFYMVCYDSNGGKSAMDEDELWTDIEEPLSLSLFVRDGYSFQEWNTRKDGSGIAYGNGEAVVNIAEKGDKSNILLCLLIMTIAGTVIIAFCSMKQKTYN